MSEETPYKGVALDRPFLADASNANFRSKRFVDINGAKQVYEGCDFSYAIFERAYFKSARFKNCRFVGARFIDCNFRSATFLVCDFAYADFERTLVEAREIVASLPETPNQRRIALQNLRANAIAIGDHDALGMLTLQEVKAATEHHRRALLGTDSYYREKYTTFWTRLKAAGHLVGYTLSGFVWGHGERPFNILFSLVTFLIALSLINFWSVLNAQTWEATGYGVEIVRYVFELFLDLTPNNQFQGFIAVDYAVAITRYVYVGIFVSILFKSISHR
jgi:hypothetical protein